MQISLVVATYGRDKEVGDLLESLVAQDCDKDIFEVIIIDQNDQINLKPIVEQYKGVLQIVHHMTTIKGLSKSKNKGIQLARAPIVTFPDDDSTFYPDTISIALNYLRENPTVDVVYGKVTDRLSGKDVMRNWSDTAKRLNLLNFSLNYSAITCFTRLKILFDENYGVGSSIASGEELDYIIRAINEKANVWYSPEIEVWHPELSVLTMAPEKVYNYGYGYGAIMRKNVNLKIGIIYFLALGLQIIKLMLNLFSNNHKKYLLTIKGRIHGFTKK